MARTVEITYRFLVQGVEGSGGEDFFQLVRLAGREAISDLYEFVVDLICHDANVDGAGIIQKRATIEIVHGEDVARYHGVVCTFEQVGRKADWIQYRAVVVPKMWNAGLTRQCQIFQTKTVKTIVEDVLKENGLNPGDDFSIELSGEHPEREFTVQYQESDLNFIRRLMEDEGVCFYFEHGETQEKLIIRDRKDAHVKFQDEEEVPFREPGESSAAEESVSELIVRQRVLPKEVVLKDYNYRKPSLEIKGTAPAVENGVGTVMEYGNHFKTPEEGNTLAAVRAEELVCMQRTFVGTSTCRRFHPGFKFTLADHWASANNVPLLLVSVEHFGEQQRVGSTADVLEQIGSGYTNQFEAIPADVQYRPPRNSPKPKLYGVINAHIDSSGSGQYADIDDQGRYKVKLPFDLSNAEAGKASRFMRKAQPYSGPDYGMHFPLHKGIEVLLTCVDGDLDRMIICGAVPNPETSSPIVSESHTLSRIRTAANNQIEIEDAAGSERIKLTTPKGNTYLHLGATNHPPDGCSLKTDDHYKREVGQDSETLVHGKSSTHIEKTEDYKVDLDRTVTLGGNDTQEIAKNRKVHIKGNLDQTVDGQKKVYIIGPEINEVLGPCEVKIEGYKNTLTIGISTEESFAAKASYTVGASSTISRSASYERTHGVKFSKGEVRELNKNPDKSDEVTGIYSIKAGVLEIKCDTEMTIDVGGTEIVIGGRKVEINSEDITLKASGTLTLSGDKVLIKSTGGDIDMKPSGKVKVPSGKWDNGDANG
jgi:type VI secretion system secreted protein VgrG